MKNKFSVGDKVQIYSIIATEPEEEIIEKGIVIHYWYDDELDCFDYYVAFFGTAFPEGKPDRIPYVLRYLETSLEKIE